MAYTNAPHLQDRLRAAIKNDLQAPLGRRRTGAAIVRALNQYLRDHGQESRVIREIENTDRYIRKFAGGSQWNDEAVKALLWELYVHEGTLVVIAPGEIKGDQMWRLVEAAFRGSVAPRSLSGLPGSYLIYKKALKDPDNLVVRGFIELKEAAPGVLAATEIHINRSYSDTPETPQEEEWLGTLLARERSFCLVSREKNRGTPKIAVLDIAHGEHNRVVTLQGHCVECIESWGVGAMFRSGVFMERIKDGFDLKSDKSLIDLVPKTELQQTHPHVISALG